jgi:hypothetical protein
VHPLGEYRDRHLHRAADEKVTGALHIRQDSLKRLQFLVLFDANVLQCALRDRSYTPNCDYETKRLLMPSDRQRAQEQGWRRFSRERKLAIQCAIRRGFRVPEFDDAVLPFGGIRCRPNEQQCINHLANRRVLAHQEHAWAGAAAHQKLCEMPRHGLAIMRNQDSILLRSERKNVGIRNSLDLCFVGPTESPLQVRDAGRQPLTIAWLKSASAKKRIIR